MKNLKTVYPILLPTDKGRLNGENIYRKGYGNLRLPFTGAEGRRLIRNGYSPFELYLVAEGDVKKRDLVIVSPIDDDRIKYAAYIIVKEDGVIYCDQDRKFESKYYNWKKVVATTDEESHSIKFWDGIDTAVEKGGLRSPDFVKPLHPKPPHSLIQDFVYSNGEMGSVQIKCLGDYRRNCDGEEIGFPVHNFKPEITEQNEVIIHRGEVCYTEEDLHEIINLGMEHGIDQQRGSDLRSGNEVLCEWINKKTTRNKQQGIKK